MLCFDILKSYAIYMPLLGDISEIVYCFRHIALLDLLKKIIHNETPKRFCINQVSKPVLRAVHFLLCCRFLTSKALRDRQI